MKTDSTLSAAAKTLARKLGLPVAAADVVIQLAAARVTERLRAVEAAEAFGERVIGIFALAAVDVARLA